VREARVQGQLEHPSIVPVYDLDLGPGGDPYFTMRRVQGDTLAQILARLRAGDEDARTRWSERRLLGAFARVCLAVEYAHEKGVLHRDLKPGNIMLGAFGEVYVLDWGLARVLGEPSPTGDASDAGRRLDEASAVETQDGSVVGTPFYMAPEQYLGERDVDGRLDVYALGLILYEIFTLRPFHEGTDVRSIGARTVRGLDVRPSLAAPETPPEIDSLCARATARRPRDRIGSAKELAEEVERFLDGVRDVERRRELATAAAETAREALEASEHAADEASREEARGVAMREVVGALALDPTQPEARATMVHLLTDLPKEPPPAVRAELEDAEHAARRRGLALASWVWVTWLATIPAVWWMGVLDLHAFLVECTLAALGTILCFDMARRRRIDRPRKVAMAAVTAATLAASTMWLGPFLLLPSAASAVLVLLTLHSRPDERRPLFAIAAAVVVGPLAVEWAGLVPASHVFEPGRLCLVARAIDIRPAPTIAMLVWSTLGFVLVPSVMLARLRDDLDAAKARLAMQAHALRALARGAPPAA
jgi:serine/threonine-protein kinase